MRKVFSQLLKSHGKREKKIFNVMAMETIII